MPIATHKWERTCARRATEQRVQAKARRLGRLPAVAPAPSVVAQMYSYTPPYAGGYLVTATVTNPSWTIQSITSTGAEWIPIYLGVGGGTLPITYQTQQVWTGWSNTIQTGDTLTNGVWTAWNYLAPEVQAYDHAEYQRQVVQAKAKRDAAHERALKLFLGFLSPEERQTLDKEQCIYVRGSLGRRYRIRCGHSQAGNVDWLDDKGRNVLATLCCHPYNVPNPDGWLVQKLALEHDEQHFVETANYSGRPRPGPLEVAA